MGDALGKDLVDLLENSHSRISRRRFVGSLAAGTAIAGSGNLFAPIAARAATTPFATPSAVQRTATQVLGLFGTVGRSAAGSVNGAFVAAGNIAQAFSTSTTAGLTADLSQTGNEAQRLISILQAAHNTVYAPAQPFVNEALSTLDRIAPDFASLERGDLTYAGSIDVPLRSVVLHTIKVTQIPRPDGKLFQLPPGTSLDVLNGVEEDTSARNPTPVRLYALRRDSFQYQFFRIDDQNQIKDPVALSDGPLFGPNLEAVFTHILGAVNSHVTAQQPIPRSLSSLLQLVIQGAVLLPAGKLTNVQSLTTLGGGILDSLKQLAINAIITPDARTHIGQALGLVNNFTTAYRKVELGIMPELYQTNLPLRRLAWDKNSALNVVDQGSAARQTTVSIFAMRPEAVGVRNKMLDEAREINRLTG